MKNSYLKFPCLIAAFYFGVEAQAQTKRDTATREKKIEEVVMIGYGSRKKVDNTTAISSINAEEVNKTKVLNATQAIQGKAAGVNVTASDLPGSTPSIVIRGLGTALGGREPLYVVDGMMVGGISNINSNDILTYDVLKDASALAIYGNRGANGVIIITTKSGKGKKINVEYDGFVGVRSPLQKVKMAGSNLFSYYTNTALGNTKFSQDQPINTDWFDEITRTGIYNQHNVSLSGASENAKYFFSASNYDEKAILKGTDYNRTTVRTNNEFRLNKNIVLSQTMSVAFFNITPKPLSAFTDAYKQSPIVPVKFENGQWGVPFVGADGFSNTVGSSFNNVGNPVAKLYFNDEKQKSMQLQGSVKLDITFLKNFKYTGQFSGQYNNAKSYNYTDSRAVWLAADPTRTIAQYKSTDPLNVLSNTKYTNFNWAVTNYITYAKKLGLHDVEATIGTETTVNDGEDKTSFTRRNVMANRNYWNLDGTNYADDNLTDFRSVKFNNGNTLSYFARAQYKYNNRYLLTATIRRDGSSQFADGKKWGTFPSFGAGWIISEEDFMNDSLFDMLKIRGGWGRLGNQSVPLNFLPFATGENMDYYFNGIANHGGITINQMYDPELSWEIVEGTNVGLDFEAFNNRLSGTVDLYKKNTTNLILQATPISTSGLENAGYSHLGEVINKGVEVSLGWRDRIGEDWSYNIGANYSYNNNELTKVGNDNFRVNPITGGSLGNGQWTKYLHEKAIGQPLGSFYLWKTDGLDENGNMKYVDVDGDGKTGAADSDDRMFFGSYIPKSTFGINLGVNYKNIDFALNTYGALGAKVYNGKKAQRFSGENIEYDVASNFWTPTNASSNPAPFNNVPIASNYYLESGDFFRINNITLGYTFKNATEYVSAIRLYVNAINPFIFQKFSGFTPELSDNGDPYGMAGVELDAYPTLRSFVFGVNIKF